MSSSAKQTRELVIEGDSYESRERNILRQLLRGHEILLDSSPPYPFGSFRLGLPETLSKWKGSSPLEVWRAVAVYMGIDPDSIGATSTAAFCFLEELRPLFALASGSVPAVYWRQLWRVGKDMALMGEMSGVIVRAENPHESLVLYRELEATLEQMKFHQFQDEFGWLPAGAYLFPYVPGDVPPLDDGFKPDADPVPRYFGDHSPPFNWPWGSHETKLLRQLCGAARLWRTVEEGGNYDPTDPDTAPTNEQVEAWLERDGEKSENVRKVMAKILRADGLRTGRRPSSTTSSAKKGSKD